MLKIGEGGDKRGIFPKVSPREVSVIVLISRMETLLHSGFFLSLR